MSNKDTVIEMKAGTLLVTKDGRKVGNAIIYKVEYSTRSALEKTLYH